MIQFYFLNSPKILTKNTLLQQREHINFGVAFLLLGALVGVMNLFIYCYFGKLATESFEKMADCLYESNWMDLNVGLQKYLILMIANTQRPIYYHGFRIAILDSTTFIVVRNILNHLLHLI